MIVGVALATEREVTVFLILQCAITEATAALCLFSTFTDTDGFDHSQMQARKKSQGPLSFSSLKDGGALCAEKDKRF